MATRTQAALRGWERRKEKAERVEGNVPEELRPLWSKVRWATPGEGFEGQTRAFLQYAHDHEGEALEALQADADAKVEALIRAHEADNDTDREVA